MKRRRGRVGVVLPLAADESPTAMLDRVEDAELALGLHIGRAALVEPTTGSRAGTAFATGAAARRRVRPVRSRAVHVGALIGLTIGCLTGVEPMGAATVTRWPGDLAFWTLILAIAAYALAAAGVGALIGLAVRRRWLASSGLRHLVGYVPDGQRAVLLTIRHGDGHPLVEAVAPLDGRVVGLQATAPTR